LRQPVSHDDLMRYLDGELPREERRRVEDALRESTELRREMALYEAMHDDLRELSLTMKEATSVWGQVNRRITRPFGWALVIAGTVLWAVYGVVVFALSPGNLLEKLAIGALVVGLLILLSTTIWERYRDWTQDPYRDIQR